MRGGFESASAARILRFPGSGETNERHLCLPQPSALFPKLDLQETGAVDQVHYLARYAGREHGSQSAGKYRGAQKDSTNLKAGQTRAIESRGNQPRLAAVVIAELLPHIPKSVKCELAAMKNSMGIDSQALVREARNACRAKVA